MFITRLLHLVCRFCAGLMWLCPSASWDNRYRCVKRRLGAPTTAGFMATGCHGDLLLFCLALFTHSSAHSVMERERGMRELKRW